MGNPQNGWSIPHVNSKKIKKNVLVPPSKHDIYIYMGSSWFIHPTMITMGIHPDNGYGVMAIPWWHWWVVDFDHIHVRDTFHDGFVILKFGSAPIFPIFHASNHVPIDDLRDVYQRPSVWQNWRYSAWDVKMPQGFGAELPMVNPRSSSRNYLGILHGFAKIHITPISWP